MEILICEADKRILQRLKTWVRAMGRTPISTDNVKEALEIFQREKPNVVLVANNLEGMSSLELVKKIRKIEPEQAIVVMLEEEDDCMLFKEMISLNIQRFIHKPIEADLFYVVLQGICKQRSWKEDIKKQEKLLKNYQSIVEQSFSITKHDKKGNMIDANDLFCSLTDMERDEVMKEKINPLKSESVDVSTVVELLEKEFIYSNEHAIILGNGRKCLFDITALPILDENKNIGGYFVVTKDIE